MTQSPNIFIDPVERPIRFSQRVPKPIFAFGESSFPVSFSFASSPREAVFAGAAAAQLGVFLTDKDAYSDPVVQLGYGREQEFVLSAVGKDVTTTSFYLSTVKPGGTLVATPAYGLTEARQPSFAADLVHSFSTHLTARDFDPVIDGDELWPSASMRLTAHRILSSGLETLPAVITSPDSPTTMVLAPASSWGIVDVEIDIVLSWYYDQARTAPSGHQPFVPVPRLGLRLYVSKPDVLSLKTTVAGATCVVGAMYPTTVLRGLGGDSVSLAYWGTGDDGVGLFWGVETGIEVSSNGLAIQGGFETASYSLANQLDDYDTSSSSSLSSSSLNSSASSSSPLKSSTSSESSSPSTSTLSSRSSSSRSSMSSSSSSSESTSSLSSPSDNSSSSSSFDLDLSSSSSMLGRIGESSSSSLAASMIALYSFSTAPGWDGKVSDETGNERYLRIGAVTGGIGPPQWGYQSGVSGGGMSFVADSSHTDYLYSDTAIWVAGMKSVAFWFKGGTTGNRVSVPFCVSNGYLPYGSKSELAVQLDLTAGTVSAWVITDGTTQWSASTSAGVVLSGEWIHAAIVHDGDEVALFVNGVLMPITFDIETDKSAWTGNILAAASPADRVCVGGAPRNWSPYVALGFSGQLDELTFWDATLSEESMLEEFSRMELLSSQSFSSQSS